MRTLFAASCLVLALTTTLAAQPGEGRRGRRGADTEIKLEHFTYEVVEMEAPKVTMGVYLPKSYADVKNADQRYPLAVWLHGRNESHRAFHADGAPVLDGLRGRGEIPELVFVALTVPNPFYVDGAGGAVGDQEKLVATQVPEFLAKKYRLADDRTKRALMGVSMGGFGALKIALRHADLFATVAAHSSALMPVDPAELPQNYARTAQRVFGNPVDAKKWAEHMPLALAGSMAVDTLKTLHIYFDAGSNDRYGFAPPNQTLHEVLEKRGVPHQFELVEGGGHSWGSGSLQKQLVKSLRFVGASFSGAPQTDGTKDAKKEAAAVPAAAGDGKR